MNKLPTVDIKGKQYVMVKDRILAFNELYPQGSIETELISPVESTTIIIKAIVIPDVNYPTRRFVDYSQAVIGDGYINKTSALENASTSAVGRALAYMGIGVIESIASADEVYKATVGPTADQAKTTYRQDPANPLNQDTCVSCDVKVPLKVKSFSLSKYNKVLCYDCQQLQNSSDAFKDKIADPES